MAPPPANFSFKNKKYFNLSEEITQSFNLKKSHIGLTISKNFRYIQTNSIHVTSFQDLKMPIFCCLIKVRLTWYKENPTGANN